MQATYAVVHIADWLQTREVVRHPDHMWEHNPLLGSRPSGDRIDAYFTSTLLLHFAVSYMLPDPYRSIWQTVWIGVEAATVVRNYNVGVRVSW